MKHAPKMYEYIERLNQLGYWMDFELSIDLILASLLDSFAQFVLDYRMNYILSTIPKLINMLKIAKGKLAKKKTKETTLKGAYFYCGQISHWKRNYMAYLESKKEVACDAPSTLGIYVLIPLLIKKYGYMIPIVAHTYGLICKA